MLKKSSIADMFLEVFGTDYKNMTKNEKVSVERFNCHVESLNTKTGVKEYKRVKNIIRKDDSVTYITKVGDTFIKTSANHRFFTKLYVDKIPYFEEICILKERNKPFYLLNSNNEWVKVIDVEVTDEITPILDMEVEDNHNYFSNGFLSHNTAFGDPRTTPGGNAMKFYASIRIELAGLNSKTTVDANGDKDSKLVRAKCIKNKTFPPFRECEYYIVFGKGIDNMTEIIDMAIDKGVIKQAGSWFSYEDQKLGQGKPSVKSILEDNEELLTEIKLKLYNNG